MKKDDLERLLDGMETAARAGGALLRDLFREPAGLQISEKTRKNHLPDFVSQADRDAESLIRAQLSKDFPSIGFVGEEGGGAQAEAYFLADPLDGTRNYVMGKPQYAVSLAFIWRDTVMASVLYAPEQDVMIRAGKDMGCRINNRPVTATVKTVDEVLLDAEINMMDRDSMAALMRLAPLVSVRKNGSTVWTATEMIAGRGCQAVLSDNLEPHDIAGCQLALAEAGFGVCGWDGKAVTTVTRTLFSAPPGAFEVMTRALCL